MSAQAGTRNVATRGPRRRARFRRSDLTRYMFVLPATVYLLVFFAYPIVYNIIFSLQDVNIATFISGNAPWVGLANYAKVIQSPTFQAAARNTAILTVLSLVFQFGVGMLLAMYYNRGFPLAGAMRSLMLLPFLLPFIVTGSAFKWLFTDPNGLVNYLFSDIAHIVPPHTAWLADRQLALPVVILANIWVGIPFNMIILHSGLQGIPTEIYEAAAIDGANRWVRFWRITLPMLRPVISILLILGLIYTVQVFDAPYVLTGGGPADASQTFSILSYQLSFGDFSFGQGAAVGNIMVLITLVLAMGYLAAVRREQSWS